MSVVLTTETYRAFAGTVDGVGKHVDTQFYSCIDGYIYRIDTPGVVYSGADSVDDTCTAFEYDAHRTSQSDDDILTG